MAKFRFISDYISWIKPRLMECEIVLDNSVKYNYQFLSFHDFTKNVKWSKTFWFFLSWYLSCLIISVHGLKRLKNLAYQNCFAALLCNNCPAFWYFPLICNTVAPLCNNDWRLPHFVINQFNIVEFNKFSIIYETVYYKGFVM